MEFAMKLGIRLGYSGAEMRLPVEKVRLAERLGFDSVWTAEAYGSDAITPLAYLAAVTSRIRLATGIMQLAGRTPAMAAMQAATVDALAGGNRVIAGLGVSGPQIVEGWYGQPWGKPYWRIRDYVAIMRKIFAREEPVTHSGREISLPYTGPGASGLGKPLKSILHMNPRLPIWLGTGSEANIKLTAEIADGWLPLGFRSGHVEDVSAVARRRVQARRKRQDNQGSGDTGEHDRDDHRRRPIGVPPDEARHRPLCWWNGSPHQEFSQRRYGPSRLRRRRGADPGDVPRRSQR